MTFSQAFLIFVASLAIAYVALRAVEAVRIYLKFRGQRLITCPETKFPEAVEVAARDVAMQAVFGRPHLHLSQCSRWPERADCAQDCLSQVEASPEDCLVWNIVDRWYAGKVCAYCHTPFTHLEWHTHRPALLNPEQKTVQWTEISPRDLPAIFETYKPVCWNCHVAESFRREHPELVTDRKYKRAS